MDNVIKKNYKILRIIKYILLIYSIILFVIFRESNFSLYSSVLALCITSLAIILTVIIRTNLDATVNMLGYMSNNYYYINFDCINKSYHLSQKLIDDIKLPMAVVKELTQLSTFIDQKDLADINTAIDDVIKSNGLEIIPLISIKLPTQQILYMRCEIYVIKLAQLSKSIVINLINITKEHQTTLMLEANYKINTDKLNFLTHILDNVPIAIWARNHDLDIIYFNQFYSKIVIQSNKILDNTTIEIDKIARSLAKSVINNKMRRDERYIISKGKRHLYQFIDSYSVESSAVISVAFDITAKDLLKYELQRNIEAQSNLLESTSNACVIFGSDRRIQFFNQAYMNLWGLESSWLEQKPLYEHILDKLLSIRKIPEQANFANFKKEQVKLFTSLTDIHNEFFYLPDGRSLRVIVIPHAFGGLLFSYEDMTNKLALESSYNTLIAVQRATLDNLQEGICVFDENGRLKFHNPSFVKMWKLSKEYTQTSPYILDLIESSGSLFDKTENLKIHKAKLLAVINRRTSMLEKIQRIDGSVINRIIVPLPDGATLLSDLDMTDSIMVERSLRERNNALEDADRIKSEFLANVSYEIRSPLTSIIGLSEMLLNNYCGELAEKQTEYIKDILGAAQQLINLINDIISLTFIETDKVDLTIDKLSIQDIIQDIVGVSKKRLELKNITYQILYEDNFMIYGDANRLKQILSRIFNNVIESSNYNCMLQLSIRADEEYIYVRFIVNNSHSLYATANKQQHDFDKVIACARQQNSFSSNDLSLSIIKNVIEKHGGNLQIEPAENFGSKIECKLLRKSFEMIVLSNMYYEKETV